MIAAVTHQPLICETDILWIARRANKILQHSVEFIVGSFANLKPPLSMCVVSEVGEPSGRIHVMDVDRPPALSVLGYVGAVE
jgi:hypothetical protein